MQESKIIETKDLSHRYSKSWAIRNISFDIYSKGVLGLLGSNGAGKSTTMNILCGVLNQTEGQVLIDGIDLRKEPEKAKKLIGYLPQTAPLHLDLTVDEYLRHCAVLRLMPTKKIPAALDEVKNKCGISHFSKRLIGNLSGGYKQRVGIAQAIIHTPKLVVLDEPTNGLDPNQIYEVRKLIKEIAKERAVIFSSHILSEVQATCQEIKMIEGGRMVFSGTIEDFDNYIAPDSIQVHFGGTPDTERLKSINGIVEAEKLRDYFYRLTFSGAGSVTEEVIKVSMENGWHLQEISLEKSSLDEIFARLSKTVVKS